VSLSLRVATEQDAPAIAAIVTAHGAEHFPVPERFSVDDVAYWWLRVDDGDAVVVTDGEGTLLGAGALGLRGGGTAVADNFTRPDARGRGVGTLLVDWTESRAVEKGVSKLRIAVAALDTAAKELLERRGFAPIRSFYRMGIDLDEPPPPVEWPDGFTVSTMQPGEERIVHATTQEAFLDHWGFQPRPFDEWLHRADLDPSLCFLVRHRDGTVVAAELCNEERFGVALVDVLAVLKPWRRRGLGEALLRHAFRELYERGRRQVGLGVDAENTTGATRLYERVGMTVAGQEDAFEKSLSPAG
jgi:mycothiol synthase